MGEVGERLVVTKSTIFTQSTPTVGTIYDVTGMSLSVTSGLWLLKAQIPYFIQWSSGATTKTAFQGYILDASNNVITTGIGSEVGDTATSGLQSENFGTLSISQYVSLSASITYKVSIASAAISGVPVMNAVGFRGDTAPGYLLAIRIA